MHVFTKNKTVWRDSRVRSSHARSCLRMHMWVFFAVWWDFDVYVPIQLFPFILSEIARTKPKLSFSSKILSCSHFFVYSEFEGKTIGKYYRIVKKLDTASLLWCQDFESQLKYSSSTYKSSVFCWFWNLPKCSSYRFVSHLLLQRFYEHHSRCKYIVVNWYPCRLYVSCRHIAVLGNYRQLVRYESITNCVWL